MSKQKNYPKAFNVRIDEKMHETLHKLSYDKKVSINQLIRLGIKKIIEIYDKPIDFT